MDPSELYLRHYNPFQDYTPADALPSFAEFFEDHAYVGSLPGKTLDDPYYKLSQLRGSARYYEDQKVVIIDQERWDRLQTKKAEFDEVPKDRYKLCRDKVNIFEQIPQAGFMNRAGLKLANIDAVFALAFRIDALDIPVIPSEIPRRYITNAFKPNQVYRPLVSDPKPYPIQDPGIFYFADLAGAPGAMSEYLLWRRPNARGLGISLRSKENHLNWNRVRLDKDRFTINYGSGKDGNLLKLENITSFRDIVRKRVPTGVNLVVADGGIDFSGRESEQEALVFPLLLGQLATATSILAIEGSLVVKMFDITSLLTIQLIQLLVDAFENISIFKPITSRPGNSERYLVGKFYRGQNSLPEFLMDALQKINEGEEITSLFAENRIDPNLIEYLTHHNESFLVKQEEELDKVRTCLKGEALPVVKYHLDRALKIWYLPEQVPILNQEVEDNRNWRGRGGTEGQRREVFSSVSSSASVSAGAESSLPVKSLQPDL